MTEENKVEKVEEAVVSEPVEDKPKAVKPKAKSKKSAEATIPVKMRVKHADENGNLRFMAVDGSKRLFLVQKDDVEWSFNTQHIPESKLTEVLV